MVRASVSSAFRLERACSTGARQRFGLAGCGQHLFDHLNSGFRVGDGDFAGLDDGAFLVGIGQAGDLLADG